MWSRHPFHQNPWENLLILQILRLLKWGLELCIFNRCWVFLVYSEIWQPLCQTMVTSFWWCEKPCQRVPSATWDKWFLTSLSWSGHISIAHLGGFLLPHPLPLPPIICTDLAWIMVWQVISKTVEVIMLDGNHFQKQVEISSAESSHPKCIFGAWYRWDLHPAV
jgi:hypothetical protein